MLMLWQGARSVVVGKNQNPWQEADVRSLVDAQGVLARRVTGGGAVFHDEGNLNYSYFCRRDVYDSCQVLGWVLDALGSCGVRAARLGKNGLGVDGRKMSGSAFCYRGNSVLHHGTLLVTADLEMMSRVLTSGASAFETHAVPSIPARVLNLETICPRLSVEELGQVLASVFSAVHGGVESVLSVDDLEPETMDSAHQDFLSWEWTCGRTPGFRFFIEWRNGGELLRSCFDVKKGRIQSVRTEGGRRDHPDGGFKALLGCRFVMGDMEERISRIPGPAAEALARFAAREGIP